MERAKKEADAAVSQQEEAKQHASKAFESMIQKVTVSSETTETDNYDAFESYEEVPTKKEADATVEASLPLPTPSETEGPPYMTTIHVDTIRKGADMMSTLSKGCVVTFRYTINDDSISFESSLGILLSHAKTETIPRSDGTGNESPSHVSPSEFDFLAVYKLPNEFETNGGYGTPPKCSELQSLLNPQKEHYKVEFLAPMDKLCGVLKPLCEEIGCEEPDTFDELLQFLRNAPSEKTSIMEVIRKIPCVLIDTASITMPQEEGVYVAAVVTAGGRVTGVSELLHVEDMKDLSGKDNVGTTRNLRKSPQEPANTTEIFGPALPGAPSNVQQTGRKKAWRRPNFCLEKHPKISVYQLYIHVPALKDLPKAWKPGFSVDNGVLLVGFQLPTEVARKHKIRPRNFFLRLPFPYRIELEKSIMHIREDHIGLRLPLFYRGEAIPDRKKYSRTRTHEVIRRGNGICRMCSNQIWSSSSVKQVFDLPASNWYEWSDFWLCHSNERSHLLPKNDITARSGSVGVGTRCYMIHPSDVIPSGIRVSFNPMTWDMNAASEAVHMHPDTVNLKGLTWNTLSRAARLASSKKGQPEAAALKCHRCFSLLGVAVACREGSENDISLTDVFSGAGGNHDSIDTQPTLCLFNDKITLSSAPKEEKKTLPDLGDYTCAHRLSADLFGHSNAYSIYRFLICPSTAVQGNLYIPPHVNELGLSSCTQLHEENSNLRSSLLDSDAPLLAITVLNWNTSMSGFQQTYHDGNSPAFLSEAGYRFLQHFWDRQDDVQPALKVRYLFSDRNCSTATNIVSSTSNAIMREQLRQWVEHYQPYLWTVFPEDFHTICHLLKNSTSILPASCQKDQSMYIGFLPMIPTNVQ